MIIKIADTLFENTTTAIYDANFDRKYRSIVTKSVKNRFLKGYLNFLSHDPCANNNIEKLIAGFLYI